MLATSKKGRSRTETVALDLRATRDFVIELQTSRIYGRALADSGDPTVHSRRGGPRP